MQVFLGHRNIIGHLLYKPPAGQSQIVERFTPDMEQWCKENMKGYVYPVYQHFDRKDDDGVIRHYARYEFDFEYEEDIVLFKLFHIG